MREAERMAKDAGYRKISVIAGVGTRGYYRKLGYHMSDYGYMLKPLVEPEEFLEPQWVPWLNWKNFFSVLLNIAIFLLLFFTPTLFYKFLGYS